MTSELCWVERINVARSPPSASHVVARQSDGANGTTYPSYRISPLDGSVIALPTADQLAFQDKEMGMLIHFEIATYISLDGCNGVPGLVPSPSLFTPTLLNTDQWMDSITAFGARYATLVAKHNCGWANWPSNVTFETRENTTSAYNYSVAYAPASVGGGGSSGGSGNGTANLDVVGMFSASAEKYGVGHGFYYSTIVNNFLNVQDSLVNATWSPGEILVSNATYDEIVMAQLTELWTLYGDLTELWFDGGYSESQVEQIQDLLQAYQPQAVVFNSCTTTTGVNGTCLSANAIRWVGTETGLPGIEIWSTGVSNDGGDPTSPYYAPAECDTTLQADDRWFWGQDQPLRPLAEMIDVYHQTVGRNCILELDLSPDRSGLVPARHAALYKALGDWIRACYDDPVSSALYTNTTIGGVDGDESAAGTGTGLSFAFEHPVAIDRVVMMEDQTDGQVIRAYEADASSSSSQPKQWTLVSNGSSIGHKRIDLFNKAITVTDVLVNATLFADTPKWRSVEFNLCGSANSTEGDWSS
ncbi:glycoside hydrolase family 29 protein [Coniella lustricola]|uniref:alpha-L-fucosidase n=1 Tax=Coniella lustricola TaxID=2025994 RepID=A0A2T2ZWG2_9PEZI|nr:glycoside hydrolase family 29 protein [Coniella lustricola]